MDLSVQQLDSISSRILSYIIKSDPGFFRRGFLIDYDGIHKSVRLIGNVDNDSDLYLRISNYVQMVVSKYGSSDEVSQWLVNDETAGIGYHFTQPSQHVVTPWVSKWSYLSNLPMTSGQLDKVLGQSSGQWANRF